MPKYVVIVEHKCEQPIVLETYLDCADEKEARKRMSICIENPHYIRVTLARLVYVDGHQGLLPTEPKEMPF